MQLKAFQNLEQIALEEIHQFLLEEGVANPEALINNPLSADVPQQALLARAYAVQRAVETARPVMELRAFETKNKYTDKELRKTLETMHEAGVPVEEAVRYITVLFKQTDATTSHPTESLSPVGQALFRKLIRSAETLPPRKRISDVRGVIREMLRVETFGAVQKATVVDEINAQIIKSKDTLIAINQLERRLENQIAKIWQVKDPGSIQICLNADAKIWEDADGKPNAEGFAMMANMARNQFEALSYLENKLNEQQEPLPPDLAALKASLAPKIDALRRINEDASTIVDQLANSPVEDRGDLYTKKYTAQFETMRQQFKEAYGDTGFNSFFQETRKTLKSHRGSQQWAGGPLDDAYRLVARQNFTLAKLQIRHNDAQYKLMLDNFIQYMVHHATDEERLVLPTSLLERLPRTKNLSELPESGQLILIRQISRKLDDPVVAAKILPLLTKANSKDYTGAVPIGGIGYPEQAYSILDRLKLAALYPLQMEEAIISDAEPGAPFRQRVFRLIAGWTTAKDMPLYEGPNIFPINDRLLALFNLSGEAEKSARSKINALTALEVGRSYPGLSVLIAGSDSTKERGVGGLLESILKVIDITNMSIESGVPVQIEFGQGFSSGRSMTDPMVFARLIGQTLKRHVVDRGYPLDPSNEKDFNLLRMLAVMYTKQGRANRLLSATSDQIATLTAEHLTEVMDMILDLTGKKIGVIEPLPDIPPALRQLAKNIGDTYQGYRHVELQDSDGKVFDALADCARPKYMMPFMNNGARPAAKHKLGGITSERAIGCDQSLDAAGVPMGMLFGAGENFSLLQDDLRDPMQSNAILDYFVLHRAHSHSVRYQPEHLLEKVDAVDWPMEKVLQIGKSVFLQKGKKSLKDGGEREVKILKWDQNYKISAVQALACKILYDRAQFLEITPKNRWDDIPQIEQANKKNRQAEVLVWAMNDRLEHIIEVQKMTQDEALTVIGRERAAGQNLTDSEARALGERHCREIMAGWRNNPHISIWAANRYFGTTYGASTHKKHELAPPFVPKTGKPGPELHPLLP